jgi:hypothetical protein
VSFSRRLKRRQRRLPSLQDAQRILQTRDALAARTGASVVLCPVDETGDPRIDRVAAVAMSREDLTWPRMFCPLIVLVDAFRREGNGAWAEYLIETPDDQVPAVLFGPGPDDAQVMRLRNVRMTRGGEC